MPTRAIRTRRNATSFNSFGICTYTTSAAGHAHKPPGINHIWRAHLLFRPSNKWPVFNNLRKYHSDNSSLFYGLCNYRGRGAIPPLLSKRMASPTRPNLFDSGVPSASCTVLRDRMLASPAHPGYRPRHTPTRRSSRQSARTSCNLSAFLGDAAWPRAAGPGQPDPSRRT